jgi:hypothetical protein
MAKTRKFGFERFYLDRKYKLKREAKLWAKHLRDLGYRARIIKIKDGWAIYKRWS